jgi:hypothetical protein
MKSIFAFPLGRAITTAAVLIIAAAAGLLTFNFIRADLTAEIYRRRLSELAGNYETLRHTYNEAVRKTAVTELIVKDNRLSILIRSAAGTVEESQTPFDPSREIYVDFVVMDSRLWIRRVFDARTPPGQGLIIDPALGDIDWQSPRATFGKAVYRTLDEGRWVVTVTGDGSLGLAKAPATPTPLAHAPEIRDYDQATTHADEAADAVGLREVIQRLIFRQ